MDLPTVAIPKFSKTSNMSQVSSLAMPIVAIAISVVIMFLITWPKFSEVLKLRESNKELTVRLEAMRAKVTQLESLSLEQNELDLRLLASEQLLPSDKSVFTFLKQVEDSAARAGVLVGRIEVAPGAVESGAGAGTVADPSTSPPPPGTAPDVSSKLLLKTNLTSDYRSFVQFLSNILSLSRVVTISDLTIVSSGESSQIRSSLSLNAYWQPLPQELGSIESPIEDLTAREEELLTQIGQTGSIGGGPVGPVVVPTVPIGKVDLFAPF